MTRRANATPAKPRVNAARASARRRFEESAMPRTTVVSGLAIALAVVLAAPAARATPSTEIWIPSVDLQPFLVPHLTFDSYVRLRSEPAGGRRAPVFVFGPTLGVLPWQKVQLEVGFDLMWQGLDPHDRYPIYFHAKLGTPEDALFTWQPALVVGVYNVGVKRDVTTQNIGYALAGRTVWKLGRFSFGYFYANRHNRIFPGDFDAVPSTANHGFLAAWDRTMKEISPRLTLLVDYQGSRSWLGAVSFGVQWAFTDAISALVAYDLYTNRTRYATPDGPQLVPGRDTLTFQVDINLDRLWKKRPPQNGTPSLPPPGASQPSP
jgi:hypothetical protein